MPSLGSIIQHIADHEDDERKELVCSMIFQWPQSKKIWGYVTLREAFENGRKHRESLLR